MNATREEWLHDATELLTEHRFARQGYSVPNVRISTGFPAGTRKSGEGAAIGQCWHTGAAEDGLCQIFITPLMKHTALVVATLAHELVHAVVGGAAKHGPVFKRCATAIGLTGKMTATVPTTEFVDWVARELVPVIGDYPHAKLTPGMGLKKQSTRMIKCQCEACGFVARTTRKWIDTVGAPLCACNSEPMEVAA